MMWWIVGGVAVLLLIALVVFAFRNRYAAVFTDRHLQEFCEKLDGVRAAACADIHDVGAEPFPQSAEEVLADPRNAQTDAGMRMSYTVTRNPDRPGRLAHHLSMSHEQKLSAVSFARFFAGLVLVRFRISPDQVAAQRSENLVTHLLWEVAEDENEAFVTAADEPPAIEDLPALRERARDVGHALGLV